jgi:hypothetical protein
MDSGFGAFDAMIDTCRRTRAVLVASIHGRAGDGELAREIVATESLDYVDAIAEGTRILARATAFSGSELRAIVRFAGITPPPPPGSPDAVAASIEAAHDRTGPLAVDPLVLLAAGHARVVFAQIPALPPMLVTWPSRNRTYADIPVPRSAVEMIERTEELERVLWGVAEGDARPSEPLRRTLAYFEAASRFGVRGGFAPA